jgi:crotonobetainyl-CoA:carnitine CoA-transferase CaiB-like acyl-CoA transferase
MFDVMLSMLAVPAAHQFAGREIAVGGKYGLSGAYPFYNVYETLDAKFMTLGALEPKFWENFCRKVGREDLIRRQFDEGERQKDLFEEVRAIFKSRAQSDWVEVMKDADCCCEPVLSMAEAFGHAQTLAREMIMELEQPGAGTVKQLGFAYRMSETPPAIHNSSPSLGEQTDELLAELGINEDERARLRKSRVVRSGDSDSNKTEGPVIRV